MNRRAWPYLVKRLFAIGYAGVKGSLCHLLSLQISDMTFTRHLILISSRASTSVWIRRSIPRPDSIIHLNAPCGAVTVAPHFVAQRLLRLSVCFCKLQFIDWFVDVCVVVCICLLHISAVICLFVKFFVISFRAQRLRWFANLVARAHAKIKENDVKIS